MSRYDDRFLTTEEQRARFRPARRSRTIEGDLRDLEDAIRSFGAVTLACGVSAVEATAAFKAFGRAWRAMDRPYKLAVLDGGLKWRLR